MGNLRQPLFTLATLLCTLVAGLLIVQNWETSISLALATAVWPQVSLGSVLLVVYALGALATLIKSWGAYLRICQDMKHYELRKEKAEVKAETHTDQIRTLESKIKTLETALAQALAASASKSDR